MGAPAWGRPKTLVKQGTTGRHTVFTGSNLDASNLTQTDTMDIGQVRVYKAAQLLRCPGRGVMVEDRWRSVDEIAEYLGVSKDTVYTWVNQKGMPGHKVGRFWKFKAAEVDDWVRAGGAARATTGLLGEDKE